MLRADHMSNRKAKRRAKPPHARWTTLREESVFSLVHAYRMYLEVATLTEQGYAGFDAAPFYGVLGPAGMSPAVVAKLQSTLSRALANPSLREKLQEAGFDVVGSTPEAYAALIRSEIDRWTAVVRKQDIKVD